MSGYTHKFILQRDPAHIAASLQETPCDERVAWCADFLSAFAMPGQYIEAGRLQITGQVAGQTPLIHFCVTDDAALPALAQWLSDYVGSAGSGVGDGVKQVVTQSVTIS